ncbi:MAG: hypothetical protein NTY45_05735 [Elusimicrobia bacterium]|nr:hypothetical protein [Elusimicrobiota bacterium]
MKLSAFLTVLFLAAGCAAAQQSAWAPAVTKETLSAVELPAAGLPARALPRDGVNYSGAEEVLIKEYKIKGISLDITEEEVGAQTGGYANSLPFEQALRLSLKSFLEDYTNPTSPLAAILAAAGTPADKASSDQVRSATVKLYQLMNMSGASLTLVSAGDTLQAPRGETVTKNWIFHLRLGYTGGSYWAIADRSAVKPVYNY